MLSFPVSHLKNNYTWLLFETFQCYKDFPLPQKITRTQIPATTAYDTNQMIQFFISSLFLCVEPPLQEIKYNKKGKGKEISNIHCLVDTCISLTLSYWMSFIYSVRVDGMLRWADRCSPWDFFMVWSREMSHASQQLAAVC